MNTILEAIRKLNEQELLEEIEEEEKNLNNSDFEIPRNTSKVGNVERAFADDLHSFIQELVDEDRVNLEETFISQNCLAKHFKEHCLGNSSTKKSNQKMIYYDFKNEIDYSRFEKSFAPKLSASNPNTDYLLTLLNVSNVENSFKTLLQGNYTLVFADSCGFKNRRGKVMIALHSFTDYVTTNYSGKTISLQIIDPITLDTISIYAIDSQRIGIRFNAIVNKYVKNKKLKPSKPFQI